jgi:hypothetical protein
VRQRARIHPDWTRDTSRRSLARSARLVAASPGIVASTLREVVSVGQGQQRNQLLATTNTQGTICVAQRGGSFLCLDGRYDPYAVVTFPMFGGSSLSVVDWASVVGIARSDVVRLVLSLEDGKTVEMMPDKWRSFSYVADRASSLPTELRAYDAGGRVLETVGLATSPPGPTAAPR